MRWGLGSSEINTGRKESDDDDEFHETKIHKNQSLRT